MRTNKSTPVNRSSLSHGHTHPVFALDIQPLASGLYQIVSCSSDGQVCVWTENNLHRPLHDVQLTNMRPGMGGAAAGAGGLDGSSGGVGVGVGSSREELTTTCFDLPSRDTNTLLLGSDEGRIYKARLHEAAPADRVYDVIHAHDAPMTSLQFHPSYKSSAAAGATAANDLFLTSSYDWTVKLWSNKLSKPLFVFEAARDYVHAAAWCPSNPYIFAAGDGTGKLDVWSLGQDAAAGDDVDVPLLSVQVGAPAEVDAAGVPLPASSPNAAGAAGSGADAAADLTTALRPNHAISALKWNHTGSMIACGQFDAHSAALRSVPRISFCFVAFRRLLRFFFCFCFLSSHPTAYRCVSFFHLSILSVLLVRRRVFRRSASVRRVERRVHADARGHGQILR